MDKVIHAVVFIVLSSSWVNAQTAQANTTINLIENFNTDTLDTLTQPFNTLRDELVGIFSRTLTALRIERSGYNTIASGFPYYQLSESTREALKGNLTTLVACTDDTMDYFQDEALTSFFNFVTDPGTPIEMSYKPIIDQLKTLEESVKQVNDTPCLVKIDVNTRNLTVTYLNFTSGINACTINASAEYREPIRNYTTLNLNMVFAVTPINLRLAFCGLPGDKEPCIKSFLAAYSNTACDTITKVGDQAKLMISTVQAKYKTCLSDVATKNPLTVNSLYQDAVDNCIAAML